MYACLLRKAPTRGKLQMLKRYRQVLFNYSENPFWTRQKALKPGVASPYVADQTICPTPLLVVRFVRRSLPLSLTKAHKRPARLGFPISSFFRGDWTPEVYEVQFS